MDARYAREQRYRNVNPLSRGRTIGEIPKTKMFRLQMKRRRRKNTKYLIKNPQNDVFESHSGRNILRNAKDEDFSSPKMFVNT